MFVSLRYGVAALAFLCLTAACAAPAAPAGPSSPAGEHAAAPAAPSGPRLDLSEASKDFPVTIVAPAGATAKPGILGVEVRAGSGFQLDMEAKEEDLAAYKKEMNGHMSNKVKTWHVDTADTLLYESTPNEAKPDKTEFHFVAKRVVDGKTYVGSDERGPTFTRLEVEAMLKSFQTIAKK